MSLPNLCICADAEASGDASKAVRDAERCARRWRRPYRDCTWAIECMLAGCLPDDVHAAIVAARAEGGGPSPEAPAEVVPGRAPALQQQKQRASSATAAAPQHQGPARQQQRARVDRLVGRPGLLERIEAPPAGVEVPAADNRTFFNAAQLVRDGGIGIAALRRCMVAAACSG